MKNIFLVGIGGFLGSILRYLISLYSAKVFANVLIGTLSVNLTGSLLIGILAGWFTKPGHLSLQLLVITGFCGGLTTFSTFSIEGLRLLRNGQFIDYVSYTTISIVGGLTLCFLGMWMGQKIAQ